MCDYIIILLLQLKFHILIKTGVFKYTKLGKVSAEGFGEILALGLVEGLFLFVGSLFSRHPKRFLFQSYVEACCW